MKEEKKKMKNRIKNRRIQASFTVEAAFIMPIVILLLVWCVSLAIDLYTQVDKTASSYTKVEKIDSVNDFRKISKSIAVIKGTTD